jgi:hypothetical protein
MYLSLHLASPLRAGQGAERNRFVMAAHEALLCVWRLTLAESSVPLPSSIEEWAGLDFAARGISAPPAWLRASWKGLVWHCRALCSALRSRGLDLFAIPVLLLIEWVVGSLPADTTNLALLEAVRKHNAAMLCSIYDMAGIPTAFTRLKHIFRQSLTPSREALEAVQQQEK